MIRLAAPALSVLLVLAAASLAPPVDAGVVAGAMQCDAGACEERGPLSGDCPSTASGACPLLDAHRVRCRSDPLAASPNETICLGNETEPVVVDGLRRCWVDAPAGCWRGELDPLGGTDGADVYEVSLAPGAYGFAMSQNAVNVEDAFLIGFDYDLCVYASSGILVPGDARPPHETEVVQVAGGTWRVAVVASGACPTSLPQEGGAEGAAGGPRAASTGKCPPLCPSIVERTAYWMAIRGPCASPPC